VKASDRYFVDGVTCRLDGRALPVSNLSVGGLFAASDYPPLTGQAVSLELVFDERTAFAIVGTVTWINTPQNPRAPELPPGFGVRIGSIPLPAKLAILDALRRAARERSHS
jgi:hypothetical protein